MAADIRPFGRVVVQCVSPFQDISERAMNDEEEVLENTLLGRKLTNTRGAFVGLKHWTLSSVQVSYRSGE